VSPASRSLHDGYGARGRSAWMDIDWRAHQRWLRVEGTTVNAIELGEGPPLLFVHGLSGCWQNWLENIPHFARTYRVIALDLPGFGASEVPREEISIAGYGRCLDQVCDQLGIDAALVVGNSMGGHIATELAISFPQRVERLVLVSAAGITTEHVQRDGVMVGGRIVAALATRSVARHDALARRPGLRRLALSYVTRHPDRLSAGLAREMMRGAGKPGFMAALEAVISYRLSERLPQIACPTLIVWGEDDRVIPVRDAARFEQLIPDARAVVLPDTGHMAMLERPEHFNALLDEFLASLPGDDPAPEPEADALSA
jgi:pimeloyl-ACP methyl ester carboxylesterase